MSATEMNTVVVTISIPFSVKSVPADMKYTSLVTGKILEIIGVTEVVVTGEELKVTGNATSTNWSDVIKIVALATVVRKEIGTPTNGTNGQVPIHQ